MKIFATSIPRAVERHEYINRHLEERTGFNWEVLGVDGPLLRRHSGDWPHAAHLRDAQVGCALSHALACQRIVEESLPAALIVEDDVILPNDVDDMLTALAREIRPDEVISLYSRTMKPEKFSTFGAVRLGPRQLVYPTDPRHMRTAAAYLIGHDAARNIAVMNNPVRYVADNWMSFHREGAVGRFRLLHPIPVRLVPFVSTLSYDQDNGLLRLAKMVLAAIPLGDRIRTRRLQSIVQRRERNVVLINEPTMFTPSGGEGS